MPRKTAKVKDKWREKSWLEVIAPSSFGGVQIAKIPATDANKAVDRVIQTTLYDLLKQDPSHYSIKVSFVITKIDGNKAFTTFRGHEYAREYMRSLVRRGSSMVGLIKDYTSRDGFLLRVYLIAFTQGRVNSSRKRRIREAADKVLTERSAALDYEQLVQEIVLNKTASEIFAEAKKISMLRHLGIRKTKLLEAPKEQPAPAPEAAAETTPS
ncbi:MAG TPA: 30S ribosomal protein S3ae [Conexivisphaerales archaeon]|nr:30S ribosomal protein S3ae [Conexivisphaerales archaeon]